MHYVPLESLRMAISADFLADCINDDGGKDKLDGILEWARDKSEAYVKSRVAVRYDLDQWEVDDDEDGISDNIDGVIVDCVVAIAVHKIAMRRYEIPQAIIDAYNIAELKLERIANGQMLLDATRANQRIAANMTEDDLGEQTQDGEALQWSGIL